MADENVPMGGGVHPSCALDAHELSPQDQRHYETLAGKLQLVKDYAANVAKGRRITGLYLYGPGGCGKSYTVMEELDRLETPYRLFNSRMTGRALYNALEDAPDAVHILEDMEQLFRDSGARGVLRSALWGQPRKDRDGPPERLVTWSTHRQEHEFVFTGGIIMTANRPFPDLPELDAIKTRIAYMHLVVSDNELKALMRHVASQGFQLGCEQMDPAECWEICEFIIDECRGLNRALDMRLLINGFSDYLQWRDCDSGCHWQDLVETRIKYRAIAIKEVKGPGIRAAQKQEELKIAAELKMVKSREKRCQQWMERTGKSEQSLYRRLQELDAIAPEKLRN